MHFAGDAPPTILPTEQPLHEFLHARDSNTASPLFSGTLKGASMLSPGAPSFEASAQRALFLPPASPHATYGKGSCEGGGLLSPSFQPHFTHTSSILSHQAQGGLLSSSPANSSPYSHQRSAIMHSPASYSPFSSAPSPMFSPSRHPHAPYQGRGSSEQQVYSVYDMKSLAAALATVQAGTGEIRRIFAACNFRPRLPGLTKLVSQLTREGNWQKGLEVFESLSVLGVRPDTTITNAAISACDKGGQWEKAMQVFHAMDQWGLPRDAITYSAVISSLSKGRQWSLAIDVFNHMSNASIECDAVTCCSLITALDKGGQWQLAEQVFVQMYQDHPQFKMLLQCMGAEGLGAGRGSASATLAAQQHPALAAAAVSPAEAMLAMLRSPRVLDAFGEVDLLAEEPPQPPLQQQQDQAGASLSRMGSLKAADWMDGGGKAGQAPSVTHHKDQAATCALSLPESHALGEAGAPGASHLPEATATAATACGEACKSGPGLPLPGPSTPKAGPGPSTPKAGPGPSTPKAGPGVGNLGSAWSSKGSGLYRSFSAFPKIDEDHPLPCAPAQVPQVPQVLRHARSPSSYTGSEGVMPECASSEDGNLLGSGGTAAYNKEPTLTDLSSSLSPSASAPLPGFFALPISTGSSVCSTADAIVPGVIPGLGSVGSGRGVCGAPADPTAKGLRRHASCSEVLDGGEGSSPIMSPGTPAAAAPVPLGVGHGPVTHTSSFGCLRSMPSSGSGSIPSPTQEPLLPGGGGTPGSSYGVDDQLSGLMQSLGLHQSPVKLTQDALSCLLSEDPATAQQAMHSLMAEQQPQQRQQQPWAAPAKGGGLVMPPASPLGSSTSGSYAESPYSKHSPCARGFQLPASPYTQPPPPPPSPYSRNQQQVHQPPYSPSNHPLYRTASAPSGANRGLLRTSSLNSKKSAPNRVCCNALLAAYARASPTQWRRAIRLLDLMWQCGGELCPDIVSYNTVIKACGNAGQIDMGFKVYHVMTLRGVEPTVATFGTLVCIAADAQATAHVKCAWQWLCASGLEVHITCANAYLQALLREGEWQEAQALFRLMLSPHSPCRPNAVTFSALISAWLSRGDMRMVKQLYNEQLACGVQPSGSTMAMLINTFSAKGMWGDALGLLSAMSRPDSCVRPAPGMFVTLFQALRDHACMVPASDMGTRKALGRHMTAARLMLKLQPSSSHPDPTLFSSMIGAFQAAADPDACVELFNSLLGCGLPIEPDVASATLAAVVEQQAWGRAVQLVRAMLEYQPSRPLGAGMCAGVLLAMTGNQQWAHAYDVIKALYTASSASPRGPCRIASSGGRGLHANSLSGLLGLMDATGRGRGGGPLETACSSCLSDLVDVLQAGNHTDLLLLVVLAEKEMSGTWEDAVSTFTWVMQQGTSVLASSRPGHTFFYELLFHHAGVEGLRQAVLLCKAAHESKVLDSFPQPQQPQGLSPAASAVALVTCTRTASAKVPGTNASKLDEGVLRPKAVGSTGRLEQLESSAAGAQAAPLTSLLGTLPSCCGGDGPGRAAGDGSVRYEVVIEGDSHTYAIVVLLAWILTLRDRAREGMRVPCRHATLRFVPSSVSRGNAGAPHPPSTSPAAAPTALLPPHALRELLGPGFGHLSDQQVQELAGAAAAGPAAPPGSSILAQLKAAAVLVLDGSYTLHLGVLGQPEKDEVFLLQPPGVPFSDSEDPTIMRMSMDAVYTTLQV